MTLSGFTSCRANTPGLCRANTPGFVQGEHAWVQGEHAWVAAHERDRCHPRFTRARRASPAAHGPWDAPLGQQRELTGCGVEGGDADAWPRTEDVVGDDASAASGARHRKRQVGVASRVADAHREALERCHALRGLDDLLPSERCSLLPRLPKRHNASVVGAAASHSLPPHENDF